MLFHLREHGLRIRWTSRSCFLLIQNALFILEIVIIIIILIRRTAVREIVAHHCAALLAVTISKIISIFSNLCSDKYNF